MIRKIIKIDDETKEVITKEGIKFKIKDLNTNEYICENEECTYQTNKEGYVITKEKLKGNLLIEEVKEKIEGYLWNNQTIEIFIGNEYSEHTNTYHSVATGILATCYCQFPCGYVGVCTCASNAIVAYQWRGIQCW